ncbi:hypothetical protein [Shimia sagamensis]|uniref:Uncharacterized protein n=1 Tax=Shimia sagamensis TaxID=1566352 RepID=A0ABY1NCC2_9RHOB|nr:hypothetical protein [Shimia sagamensis]SMP05611.1 hypothetical protein SAMN06265373_101586 [Shimia sagamensis]
MKQSSKLLVSVAALGLASTAYADQVILDDLIVDGSACIGMDCVNGESFGFDTLRLKENNLRIKFQDTSATASFPGNDWQLTANDSTNGGANKFSIDDIDGGRTPFTVEAGAPTNALYVEADGDVGVGTNNPVVEAHIVDGDSPTLRLEQNGSSGFTPQTWDMAGNETNFFVRDVTNGSALSFRIFPGSENDDGLVIRSGRVGVSTDNPSKALHVRKTDGTASLFVEEASATAAARTLMTLSNNGSANFELTDTSVADASNSGRTWKMKNTSGKFLMTTFPGGPGETELTLDQDGNLTISGNFFASSGTQLNVPDYVFEDEYDLMPLSEVRAFIDENGHLPNVPSAGEINATGLNMTEMQLNLLEKVEELTLYTLEQDQIIRDLSERLNDLEG